jgi:hypothetical protein
MYFKNYQKYWIPYAHALTFMRRLSRRVRNWCNPDHMHQFFTHMLSMRISFSIFQMFILRTLSMRLRNWCMQWPCASGTDAYAEHIRQELMRALSLRVRNWCVHWACMSGTDACIKGRTRNWCTRSARQVLMCAQSSVPSKFAEHTHQELLHTLSIRVRN